MKKEDCKDCGGEGYKMDADSSITTRCDSCNGTGKVLGMSTFIDDANKGPDVTKLFKKSIKEEESRTVKKFGKEVNEIKCKACGLWRNTAKHDKCPNCTTLNKVLGESNGFPKNVSLDNDDFYYLTLALVRAPKHVNSQPHERKKFEELWNRLNTEWTGHLDKNKK